MQQSLKKNLSNAIFLKKQRVLQVLLKWEKHTMEVSFIDVFIDQLMRTKCISSECAYFSR